jgi:hypothetical protein
MGRNADISQHPTTNVCNLRTIVCVIVCACYRRASVQRRLTNRHPVGLSLFQITLV